jgi:hypothetical protein
MDIGNAFKAYLASDNFANIRPHLNHPQYQERAVFEVFKAGATAGTFEVTTTAALSEREPQPYLNTATDFHARMVTREKLLALGLDPSLALRYTNEGDVVAWKELVLMDGMLALAALDPDELNAIREALMEQGARIPLANAKAIAHYMWTAASMFTPDGPWRDGKLTSAVAAGLLLKVAQEAWSAKKIIVTPELPN